MPGFVQATVCIHLMDCQGRGSPPWETVEWLLSRLFRGRGALHQHLPRSLRGPGDPCMVLDQYDRQLRNSQVSFIACAQETGRRAAATQRGASRIHQWAFVLLAIVACGSVQVCPSDLEWPLPTVALPCKLRPHWLDAEKKPPEGAGSGVKPAGRSAACFWAQSQVPLAARRALSGPLCQDALQFAWLLSLSRVGDTCGFFWMFS